MCKLISLLFNYLKNIHLYLSNSHKELTEQVLDTITNLDITNTIKKDYEDQIQNIYKEQQGIIEKLWQKYLKKYDH